MSNEGKVERVSCQIHNSQIEEPGEMDWLQEEVWDGLQEWKVVEKLKPIAERCEDSPHDDPSCLCREVLKFKFWHLVGWIRQCF